MHIFAAIGNSAAIAANISRWGRVAAPMALDAAAKATIVLLVAWAVARVMLRASAASRHWVWLLALASLPALPVLNVVLPAWRVLPTWGNAPPAMSRSIPIERPTEMHVNSYFNPDFVAPAPEHADTTEGVRSREVVTPPNTASSTAPRPAISKVQSSSSPASPITSTTVLPATAAPPLKVHKMPDLWGWALVVWVLGMVAVLAMPLSGLIALAVLANRARRVADAAVLAIAQRLAAELKLPENFALLEMPAALPMTWGIFRAKVLLPSEAVRWPAGRLESVLLHEFGHVLRRDCLAEWIGRIACAAYWFHPLAWIAARRLAKEREIACDDMVLSRGQDAPAYAEHLLHVVTAARGRFLSRAAIPMARARGLESRLRSILDGRAARQAPSRRFVLLLCAIVAALVLPLAMSRAQVSRPQALPATAPGDVHPSPPATTPIGLPATEPAIQSTEARVSVRVLDEAGRPVGRAKVRMTSLYPHMPEKKFFDKYIAPDQTTADDGTATFTVAPAAAANTSTGAILKLLALVDGHAPTYLSHSKRQVDRPLEIRLTAGKSITGTVHRPDGTPVPHAIVRALYRQSIDDLPQEFIQSYAPTGTTDDQGKFQLEHVAAVTYMLGAADEASSPPLCTETTNIDVPPDRAALPLELTAKPSAIIKGRVVTTHDAGSVDRQPIMISLRTPTQSSWYVKVQPDGSFTAAGIPPTASGNISPLANRPYITEAKWPAPPGGCDIPLLSSVRFTNLRAGVYAGLQFHLYEPAKLHALVVDEAGKPFEKVGVHPTPGDAGFFTDAAGHVTANIPPGVDAVVEFSAGGLAEKQKDGPMRLKEGESLERRYIFRRAAAGPLHNNVIAGRVIDADGRPVVGAVVELGNQAILPRDVTFAVGNSNVAEHPSWTSGIFAPPRVTSDAQGRFRFDMLLAGRTDVWADKDQGLWGWVRDVAVGTDTLTLSIGRPIATSPTFSGQVIDAAGHPVTGATVTMFDGAPYRYEPVLAETTSDAAGRYSLKLKSFPTKFEENVCLVCRSPDHRVTWRSVPACGGEDIRLVYGPQASVSGRVVDKNGMPLSGARVWLRLGNDPETGVMHFTNTSEPYTPQTETAADGSFVLKGLREGCVVSIFAKHPLSRQGERWYVNANAPDTNLGDIVVADGISLSGTVRYADNGQPAEGAEVRAGTIGYGNAAVAKTDVSGAYRLRGLGGVADVSVVLKKGPGYEASARYSGMTRPGDSIEGFDLTLRKAWSARQTEWINQHAAARPTGYRAAVIDDRIDASYNGGRIEKRNGVLTLLDGDGALRWKSKPLSLWPVGDRSLVSTGDGGCCVFEYETSGLTGFNASGDIIWHKEDSGVSSMAADPQTGNVWALKHDYSRDRRDQLIVLGPGGKQLQNWPMNGNEIVYSAHDRCFWVLGEKLTRIALDGSVLAQVGLLNNSSQSVLEGELSTNEADGSIWVTWRDRMRATIGGLSWQLYIVSAEGRVMFQSKASDTAIHFTVDGLRNVVWARVWEGDRRHIERQALADRHRLGDPLPVDGDIAIEPDTGCAWIAGPDGIGRLDPEGKPIWFHPTPGNTDKAIALIKRN